MVIDYSSISHTQNIPILLYLLQVSLPEVAHEIISRRRGSGEGEWSDRRGSAEDKSPALDRSMSDSGMMEKGRGMVSASSTESLTGENIKSVII